LNASGIDLDNQIIAENGLHGRLHTRSVDQRIACRSYRRSNKENSSHSHPISTAPEAICG
jgi:hypothetical protein